MNQQKFYNFRKKCVNGVLINGKYSMSQEEMKDIIDNIVVSLEEINDNCWLVILEEDIVDNSEKIYIEKI